MKNVGKTDAVIRMILALIIALIGYYYRSWWGLLALVPLATGFLNFCPLYKLFRINTCKRNEC